MKKSSLKEKVAHCIATGLWSGLSPIMPGTVGSVAAFLLSLLVFRFIEPESHITVSLTILAFCVLAGLWSCGVLLRSDQYDSENHDPQEFVIDEFAGYFVAVTGLTQSVTHMLVGLFCFRAFDILKPPPVNTVEQLPGAWGIMFDDIVAGIYAAIVTRAIISLW